MNGAGVPPTDWKFHEEVQGGGGGLAGGVCLKLHWVHLKNQKHIVFLLLSSMGFCFFLQKWGGKNDKKRVLSVHSEEKVNALCLCTPPPAVIR